MPESQRITALANPSPWARRHTTSTYVTVRDLSEAGLTPTEIRDRLASNGIEITRGTIRRYIDPDYDERRRQQVIAANRRRRGGLVQYRSATPEFKLGRMLALRAGGVTYSCIAVVVRLDFGDRLSVDQVRHAVKIRRYPDGAVDVVEAAVARSPVKPVYERAYAARLATTTSGSRPPMGDLATDASRARTAAARRTMERLGTPESPRPLPAMCICGHDHLTERGDPISLDETPRCQNCGAEGRASTRDHGVQNTYTVCSRACALQLEHMDRLGTAE